MKLTEELCGHGQQKQQQDSRELTHSLCALHIGLSAHQIQVLFLKPPRGFLVNTSSLQLAESISECGARKQRVFHYVSFPALSFSRCFRFTSKLSGKHIEFPHTLAFQTLSSA